MLSRILARLGLVPLARYRKAAEDSKKWESRTQRLSEELTRVRAEVSAWRSKTEEAAKTLKHSRNEAERDAERFKKLRLEVEKKSAEAKEKAGQADARRIAQIAQEERRVAMLEELQRRLVTAERELTIARENLMAVEVKLDILEGAANVLDARSRDALMRRGAETGAPV